MADELIPIGYVIKTHGVKGHLRIAFNDNCKELSISEALYFLVRGNMVPYFIEEIEYLRDDSTLVLFEEFTNKESADLFTKREVFGPPNYLTSPNEEEESPLIGMQVVDEHAGELGAVTGLIDMGEYELLEVDYQGQEIMVPLHDETIVSIDEDAGVIYVRLPDGLLNL